MGRSSALPTFRSTSQREGEDAVNDLGGRAEILAVGPPKRKPPAVGMRKDWPQDVPRET
jgi:hypothetical protein